MNLDTIIKAINTVGLPLTLVAFGMVILFFGVRFALKFFEKQNDKITTLEKEWRTDLMENRNKLLNVIDTNSVMFNKAITSFEKTVTILDKISINMRILNNNLKK